MLTHAETRNRRAATDKERRLYLDILGQDIHVFLDWASWMWIEVKEQLWAYHHRYADVC
jgi:hypothetical protein